jgi:hypothetical protein
MNDWTELDIDLLTASMGCFCLSGNDRIPKTEHNQDIRQSEKKFCTAMQPIHIGKFFAIVQFGVDASGNRDGNKHQSHVKANQGEAGELARSRRKPEKTQVRKQGQAKQGFFR